MSAPLSFALDHLTGDLEVSSGAGIILARLTIVEQVELIHRITGAHLQVVAWHRAQSQAAAPSLFSPSDL